MKTAILVDGGFYRRRAQAVLGDQTAEKRAIEPVSYTHLDVYKRQLLYF